MAEFEITIDNELIQGLLFNDCGTDQLLEAVLNQVLESEMTEHLQAAPHERTDEREGQRNGHYDRQMTTRVGELTLRVPRDREGDFRTELFERYQRNERALVVTLMEIVINGVSTRRVKNLTEELCGRQFSKSTVSRLAQNIDELVDKWCNRPLDRHRYPVVLIDAMQIKVRRNGAVRPTSALIDIGINEDGMREILGVQIANSESEQSWQDHFDWLKDRGLTGVEVVVSDAHSGLVSALHRCFQGARWQRCQVHLKRNLKDKVPASCWEAFNEALDDVLKADSRAEARGAFNELAAQFEDRADAVERVDWRATL